MVTMLSSSKTITNSVGLPFELVTSEGKTKLLLKGRLGVQQAGPLWDCLRSALRDGTSIELDADALDGMDTSIVQILCRAAMESNPVRIGRVSEGFSNALKLRGLEAYFAVASPVQRPPKQVAPTPRKRTLTKSRTKGKANA